MNKEQIKGRLDEATGAAKREAGEWAGDGELQVEGMAQQVKGKLEETWGNAKEAVREANAEAAVQHETRLEVEIERAAVENEKRKGK